MAPPVSTKRPSGRSGAAIELSRDAVIDHALDVADREGLDAVAIRRIAADFSVTPMALYWHVRNKDELLEAMGDRIFDELEIPPAGGDWLDRIRDAVSSVVDVLRRHPGSVELAFGRILTSPRGRQLTEQSLGTLRGAGFSVREASDLARQALQTAVMLVSGRPGAELGTPESEREAVTAAKHAALAGLSADEFPNLVACADALTACDDEQKYYSGGIDLYIAGVKELHERRRPAAS